MCILATKHQFSHQYLYDSDSPTAQELGKVQNNAQQPIPARKTTKTPIMSMVGDAMSWNQTEEWAYMYKSIKTEKH